MPSPVLGPLAHGLLRTVLDLGRPCTVGELPRAGLLTQSVEEQGGQAVRVVWLP